METALTDHVLDYGPDGDDEDMHEYVHIDYIITTYCNLVIIKLLYYNVFMWAICYYCKMEHK